jgi:endonuclease/exonuclease/phosphatase (EEP) superfamily protein YafD
MPEFGLGIISKYPLVNTRVEEDFVGQTADLLFDGDVITVINVHPLVPEMKFAGPYNPNSFRMLTYYDTSNRTRQLNNIMSKAKEIQNKLIVVGDFNTSDNEAVYKQLRMVMKDVYRETSGGFGFTFPNRKLTWPVVFPTPIPLVRIDYIWIKGSLTALEAQVDCKKGASDHCILISTLVKS